MLSFPNADIFNSPKFLTGIVDTELRKWALNLNSLWKSLGRKVRINSTFKDAFNSDCKLLFENIWHRRIKPHYVTDQRRSKNPTGSIFANLCSKSTDSTWR